MKLRKLIIEVATRWTGEAKLKAVKVLGDAASVSLRGLSNTAESMAVSLERSATRGAAAMRELGDVARAVGRVRVRTDDGGGAAGGGSGRAPRVRDEGLAAAKAANRQATKRRPAGGDDLDKAIAGANKAVAAESGASARAGARMAGLAAGSTAIRDATAALGPFASKSQQAKAAVEDLVSQVARNRRELTALKAEALKTGDADKTLAARMQGLSVATMKASGDLAAARRNLRALEGGLIDAIKRASTGRVTFQALGTALGNLAAGAAARVFHGITDSITGAVDKATKFESSLVSISKVARGADDTAEGFRRIKAGITDTSKALGVLPGEVAELTAQLAPVFSDVSEGTSGAKVDLVELTGKVTKIGVAWDITGAQAGKAFADISRGLGTTTTETESLFGGINELGNQLGTKAADVAEAVQRSAGVLKGASISGETGAALNATLIATGASAEVAATGVRTFVARLGAGEAATKQQLAAFKALGLSAKDVAKELTSGDSVRAEKQIRKVVEAIGGLDDDKRLPVLIEMFGSESIGSIGAAATATDLLAKSFEIMSDKAASATSVQKEFDRVGETSAAKMAKLKANVEVLAISFGEALLPHINKVVDFLTSPEGQEWGRGAVEKAVGAVTTFASALGTIVSILSDVSGSLGGTVTAIGSVSLAALALAGPAGPLMAVGLAGVMAGKMIADSFTAAQQKMTEITKQATAIKKKEHDERQKVFDDELAADQKGQDEMFARRKRAQDLADRYYRVKAKGKNGDDLLKVSREANQLRTAVEGNNRMLGGGTEEDRLENLQTMVDRAEAGPEVDKRGRFRSLASKELDIRKPSGGSGGGTWTDEQKRIKAEAHRLDSDPHLRGVLDFSKTGYADRLASAGKYAENNEIAKLEKRSPQIAALLKQGRTVDKNGVLSKASNELDQALEERGKDGAYLPSRNLGVSGAVGSSASAGPSLSNTFHDNRTTTLTIEKIEVPPNSSPTLEGRLRAAATTVANDTLTGIAQAEARFTGRSR